MNTMNKPKIYYVHKRNLFDANDVVEKEIQHPDLIAVYLIHDAGLLRRIAKAARRFVNAHAALAADPPVVDEGKFNEEVHMEAPWGFYRRKGLSEMRPYKVGEDLTNISVNKEDTPELGGMIARNPDNHADQWYVSKAYFEKNLEQV